MSYLEAISILLEHGSENKVMDYIAAKMRVKEDYFKKFNKQQLINDFLTS
ncbi:MAG: hypothetical protein PWR10_2056 [Halanaerobiales bacterium]|nr:hypothetical protein [Halanaerobiales bacterium]